MIETTTPSATASGTDPVAAKTKRTRGLVNQRQAQAMTKAEQAATAAKQADYAEAMTARGVTTEIADGVLTDVGTAREAVAAAVAATTARKTATREEKALARALLVGLKEVQKAAKQKYARSNRTALSDYFVGQELNGSRPNLLQTSAAIIDRVADDTLPGITATKKTKLKTARQAWVDKNTEQLAHAGTALAKRAELRTLLKSIEDRRIAIQLAADAEWPHTDDAHAGIRKEFAIAPRQPVRA